ncbi:NB-ARC domain-containing protein [Floridanema aerugineum]|uniref:NB-ARC domain-containing protein n=1 Tax=Floridaenema aerugineum BLCC-F46 TaxID=3153654 RepID=A0ABV4X2L9_9CYAN
MIPQEFLRTVATEHGVSNTELTVLSMALDGKSILAIATQLEITPEAVRKRLGEVYKKFRIGGAGPGKLAKLQQILISLYQKGSIQVNLSKTIQEDNAEILTQPCQDWGEAPDVSIFYGREEELTKLEQWIVSDTANATLRDRCRLVALLGMVGIGKTALSVKLGQKLQEHFDYVIWRSLRHPLLLEDLLGDILPILSPKRNLELGNSEDRISQILEICKTSRCLIILDNLETILRSGDFAGHYEEKYKEYSELLRRIGEEPHQSCLIVTSVEKPREVAFQEGESLPVRSWQVAGLNEADAGEILKAKGLSDSTKWGMLIKLYRGNPLALKIVSTTIQEVFCGSVVQFLKQRPTLVLRDMRNLIEEEFERLSELEKEITNWLAISDHPVSLKELQTNMWISESELKLFEALESLGRRSLIEKSIAGFTLPPVVMEYVKNLLVEQSAEEIIQAMKTGDFKRMEIIKHYCWTLEEEDKTQKEGESLSMMQQILEVLRKIIRNPRSLREQLNNVLSEISKNSPLEIGYATDNLEAIIKELSSN